MQSQPRKWVLKPLSPRLELSELRRMVSPNSEGSLSDPTEGNWGSQLEGSQSEAPGFQGISVSRAQASVTVSPRLGEEAEDVMVLSRQVAVAKSPGSGDSGEGDTWSADGGSSSPSTPSIPGTPSSAGSHTGFYSFVEDPTSPEAEKNEEWMVSPERQAKLARLKQETSFTLQTYALDRKPERLFEESNADSRYWVDNTITTAAQGEGEKDVGKLDRMEIIRDQAPRTSRVFKEQWSALESLDLNSAPRRLVEGFSICYSPASPVAEPTPVEPDAIDDKQIDFNTARKQFLMMEQSKHSPVTQRLPRTPHSPAPIHKPHTPTPTYTPYSSAQTYASQVPIQLHKYMFPEETCTASENVPIISQSPTEDTGQRQMLPSPCSEDISNMVTVMVTEDEKAMKLSSITEFDSGLGDQLGGDTSDGSVSYEQTHRESTTSPIPTICEETSTEREVSIAQETPIEREIRIAQEREESLRKARGIRHSMSEMVEIKTKPLLSQPPLPGPARPVKAKESNRVSFLIQRELERKNRWDEAVSGQDVEKGHGLYNMEVRRKVFEPQLEPTPAISPKHLDVSQRPSSIQEDSWITGRPTFVETAEQSETEEGLPPCCPHRHAEHVVLPVSRMSSTSSSESSWGSQSRQSTVAVTSHQAAEEHRSSSSQGVSSPVSVQQKPFSSLSSTGAFSSSSLSSQIDVGQDWKQTSPLDMRWKNTPYLIRQEIERDLQREQEHLELRESLSLSVSLEKGLDDVDSTEKGVTISMPTNTAGQSGRITEMGEPSKELVPPEKQIKPVTSRPSHSWSVDMYPMRRIASSDKILHTPSSPRTLYSRLPSVSMVTAQPWGNQRPSSPVASRGSPLVASPAWVERGVRSTEALGGTPSSAQKGLTETLLEDFEERRAKLRMEESAYAGIQPIDDVNNEVLEATRVTRHKNTRALRWEAGMYANEDAN